MSLVKHPDVLRKIVQKFFGLWASFSFSAGKSVCFRGKILYFLREYLSDAAVYLLKRSFEDYHFHRKSLSGIQKKDFVTEACQSFGEFGLYLFM